MQTAWLMNLTTRSKILLTMVPLVATAIASLLFASLEMSRIDDRYRVLIERKARTNVSLARSHKRLILIEQELFELIALADLDQRNRADASIGIAINEYLKLIADAASYNREDAVQIGEILKLFNVFQSEAQAVRAKALLNADVQALDLMSKEVKPAASRVHSATTTLIDQIIESMDRESKEFTALTQKNITYSWIVMMCGLTLSVGAALYIVQREVVRVILTLRDKVTSIAAGALDTPIPFQESTNEIGEISRALQTLLEVVEERALTSRVKAETAATIEYLQGAEDYQDFATRLLSRLAESINVQRGALYLPSSDNSTFELAGGYALEFSGRARGFSLGEELVGQCARDKRPVEHELATASAVTVDVGVGRVIPRWVAVIPILRHDHAIAVLALATASALNASQRALLHDLLLSAGVRLEILTKTIVTKTLLAETQAQAEKLAVSEMQLKARKDELQMALQEVEAGKAQLTEITGTLPVGVYQVVYFPDGQRHFSFVSAQVEEIIGVPPSALLADPTSIWRNVVQEDVENGRQLIESFLRRAFAGNTVSRGEMILKLDNGNEERYVLNSAHYVPMKDGSVAASGFFQDISKNKKAEKAMAEARMLAEETNRAKSDFLARMSHEIRTPMNAVIGMTHLALMTELTAKQHDYISKIQAAANSLLGIINDILDFSKIEAGKMDIESIPFDLDEILDNAASIIAVKAEEKGLEVIFDIAREVPSHLVGDPLRLTQVLLNLSNNAIKFTEHGHVLLSAKLAQRDSNRVVIRFTVTDTGIGLTEEQIGRLFQSFSQADGTTTRKYGGTGLGLAICKRLVNLMGGEAGVESIPGQGSTFWFTMPAGVQEKFLDSNSYVPALDLRGIRCLVADDNPEMRRILAESLESFSFRVTAVSDGQAALEEVSRAADVDPYKLIILDWQMPPHNGNDVAKRIAAQFGVDVPQILMVTGQAREDLIHQAQVSGIKAFLVKPISTSTLFDTIMEALGKEVAKRERSSKIISRDTEAMKGIRGARVLLAEDNKINQQVATELLEQAGLDVFIANNGQEAVEAVKAAGEGKIDAVLMDIQMPEMDGLTASRAIRDCGKPGADTLPIIAMTANALSGDKEKSIEAGMNDHVTKPINPGELFAALIRWIKPNQRQIRPFLSPSPGQGSTDELPLAGAPGLSLKLGLSRVSGNRALYKKLLLQFASSHADDAIQIKSAIEDKERDKAVRLAHTIVSVAGNIGALELSKSASDLERALKTLADDEIAGPLGVFETLLLQAVTSIHSLEDGFSPATDFAVLRDTDFAAARVLLEDIVQSLKPDIGRAFSKAEELEKLLSGSAVSAEFNRLKLQMDAFDTDNAALAAKKLADAIGEAESQNLTTVSGTSYKT